MRFGLGVVLGVASLASCGQSVRSSSGSGGAGESTRGGEVASNGGTDSTPVAGSSSPASGSAGASPGEGGALASGGSPGAGGRGGTQSTGAGQGPGNGGGEPSAGAAGQTNDEYLYCTCSCCSRSLVVDETTCYFPDVPGDLERVKADEAAQRAREPCADDSCGIGVPYRACVAAEPDTEPTADYSSMPYVGGINRVYITKREGDSCTRLELTNEREPNRLRTAIEGSSGIKVTSAFHAPCSGQTQHWMIGVSGALSARGGSEHCVLDLHVTAFFVDQKTGQEPLRVRFDFDDMDLGNVPIACPP